MQRLSSLKLSGACVRSCNRHLPATIVSPACAPSSFYPSNKTYCLIPLQSSIAYKSSSTHAVHNASPSASAPLDKNKDIPATYETMKEAFFDAKTAHSNKTNVQLLRAILVFTLCQWDWLVDRNKELMRLTRRVLGRRLFRLVMKATFFSHFVAGEDQVTIKPVIFKSRQFGVKSILDYSVEEDLTEAETKKRALDSLREVIMQPEKRSAAATQQYQTSVQFADRSHQVISARTYFYQSELACERHKDTFLRCIDAVTDSTRKEGFAAIKLTALGRPQLLLQMSDFLVQMERFFTLLTSTNISEIPPALRKIDRESFRQGLQQLGVEISHDAHSDWFTLLDVRREGKIDLLDWSNWKQMNSDLAKIFRVRNTQTGEYEQLVPTLTEEGMEEARNMMRRIDEIASAAKAQGVRLMVDAEQTYFQPAIRRIVMELMRKFNKDMAVVFNTYQCYLKDALNYVHADLHRAEVEDFYFGAKIVRGAYMEQERIRARELKYEDPICESYDATTAMYNLVLEQMFTAIHRREKGKVAAMLATHNEASVLSAIRKMHEHQIKLSDRLICFGQLYGMCDHMSYNLAAHGFSVYKYLPYGPVEEVLPYLSRRALENRAIMKGAGKDRKMLLEEFKRRLLTGQWIYTPSPPTL